MLWEVCILAILRVKEKNFFVIGSKTQIFSSAQELKRIETSSTLYCDLMKLPFKR